MEEDALETQEFFRTLLNWRKENPVIHTGKLLHFAPENGTYVYGRYNDDTTVMIVLNKNNKRYKLELERYSELTGSFSTGRDVLTGNEYPLTDLLSLPPSSALILELK